MFMYLYLARMPIAIHILSYLVEDMLWPSRGNSKRFVGRKRRGVSAGIVHRDLIRLLAVRSLHDCQDNLSFGARGQELPDICLVDSAMVRVLSTVFAVGKRDGEQKVSCQLLPGPCLCYRTAFAPVSRLVFFHVVIAP